MFAVSGQTSSVTASSHRRFEVTTQNGSPTSALSIVLSAILIYPALFITFRDIELKN
jgi:hypothetical protein